MGQSGRCKQRMRRMEMFRLLPAPCMFIQFQSHASISWSPATTQQRHVKPPLFLPRLRLDQPLGIGPCRRATLPGRANEKAQCSATFGRELQAAEITRIELATGDPHGSHAGTAQSLIEGPDFVRLISGAQ